MNLIYETSHLREVIAEQSAQHDSSKPYVLAAVLKCAQLIELWGWDGAEEGAGKYRRSDIKAAFTEFLELYLQSETRAEDKLEWLVDGLTIQEDDFDFVSALAGCISALAGNGGGSLPPVNFFAALNLAGLCLDDLLTRPYPH